MEWKDESRCTANSAQQSVPVMVEPYACSYTIAPYPSLYFFISFLIFES
jgi:hypothetical protein